MAALDGPPQYPNEAQTKTVEVMTSAGTWDFKEELRRWGPDSIEPDHVRPDQPEPDIPATDERPNTNRRPVSVREAEHYCRRLARVHYENFPLASSLLPARLRQHFFNVYAYCRWADDLSDEVDGNDVSLRLLHWWNVELDACFEGSAVHPVFIALRTTIDEFAIPKQPFADLITAFEQDQQVNSYDTFAQLLDYCRCSANPVGRLVLFLCRSYTEQNASWSDSICTGLQLANFWQDVGRDLKIGRVYLPREDRQRFGYTDEQLHSRTSNSEFRDLLAFEVDRAREYLLNGLPLVERLPGRLQVDIELFARGGLKILDRIQAAEYQVWEQRPVVTKVDLLQLFAGCLGRAMLRSIGVARSRSFSRSKFRSPPNSDQFGGPQG